MQIKKTVSYYEKEKRLIDSSNLNNENKLF